MTLNELIQLLRRRIIIIIGFPVLLALVVIALTVMNPKSESYISTAGLFLETRVVQDNEGNVTNLAAGVDNVVITDSAVEMLKSDEMRERVSSALGTDISAYSIDATNERSRVITLTVSGPDAKGTTDVAKAVAENATEIMKPVGEIESVVVTKAASDASVTNENTGVLKRVVVALVGGLFLAVCYAIFADSADKSVRDSSEAEKLTGLPVVAKLPSERSGA